MRRNAPRARASALAAISASVLLVTTLPASAGTNDPLRSKQWGLDQIHVEQAWATSTGQGAVVAVVDTGVDLNHPDLAGQLVTGATFTGCKAARPCGTVTSADPTARTTVTNTGRMWPESWPPPPTTASVSPA